MINLIRALARFLTVAPEFLSRPSRRAYNHYHFWTNSSLSTSYSHTERHIIHQVLHSTALGTQPWTTRYASKIVTPPGTAANISQNRAGSKFGGGGVASQSATNADRRERLRKLALETIDLDKDPYFFKNHVGSFECRLCLTVHQNDGSYLAHTQGRKHQTNLARRAAKEQREGKRDDVGQQGLLAGVQVKKNVIKIGRPGYRITKVRDPNTRQNGLLFQFQFPDLNPGIAPKVRFMSAYEQKVEEPDPNYQYFIVAGEPYETVSVKLQAREVDRREGKFWTWFDEDNKEFWCQILFKTERDERFSAVPGLAPGRK